MKATIPPVMVPAGTCYRLGKLLLGTMEMKVIGDLLPLPQPMPVDNLYLKYMVLPYLTTEMAKMEVCVLTETDILLTKTINTFY